MGRMMPSIRGVVAGWGELICGVDWEGAQHMGSAGQHWGFRAACDRAVCVQWACRVRTRGAQLSAALP